MHAKPQAAVKAWSDSLLIPWLDLNLSAKPLEEDLKMKVNGCHVYVHFHHDGETLPVDIDELKRARIRPIQVFDVANDPILNRQ